jgi:tyrosine-specific transport protein
MQSEAVLKQHFVGATLLIAGCCIGAGMLGLPLITAFAGFIPSTLILFLSWLFMLATGLLLVEVYLYFNDDISIISMAKRTLGKVGSLVTWVTFLFLFYCLLTAYVSGCGSLIKDFFNTYLGMQISPLIPLTILIGILGFFIYLGTAGTDKINRLLMVGLVLTFFFLIALSLPYVNGENLTHTDWKETFFIIPPFIISFGYHNLIPSIGSYLKRNAKAMRWAVIIGSSIPFFVYLIWEFVLLGMIPVDGENGFQSARELGLLPAQILKGTVNNPYLTHTIDLFSFFAITTSFLAIALSITDFLADGLKMPKDKPLNRFILCMIVLIPPFFFALSDPNLFFIALKRAGGIGAVILFGVIPALMAWNGRYKMGFDYKAEVKGGKPVLILIATTALLIVFLHLVDEWRVV